LIYRHRRRGQAGSHLDSMPAGGKYDGPYGVLLGREIVRTLHVDAITLGGRL
jgi:hypothetical protein